MLKNNDAESALEQGNSPQTSISSHSPRRKFNVEIKKADTDLYATVRLMWNDDDGNERWALTTMRPDITKTDHEIQEFIRRIERTPKPGSAKRDNTSVMRKRR